VLRYYGGKWRLAPRLIKIFPEHHVYVEAFGGAASVLMLKPRSDAEIYNDLDGEIVNVFRILQVEARARKLEKLLRVTPFARAEFVKSYRDSRDPIEQARRTIMRSFMGFGSDSITRVKSGVIPNGFCTRIYDTTIRTGFRFNSLRSNVSAAEDWSHYPDYIQAFCARLKGVVIENRNALRVMVKSDRVDTLHYVDPPYPSSVRNRNASENRIEHNYRHELTLKQHEKLAETLHSLKGMVVVSSYPGDLYNSLFSDWKCLSWTGEQFCHGSKTRTECVWLNRSAVANQRQSEFAFSYPK
jgi:DNA adenine methylase